jgi:cytochrome c oxidase assembly protein subunit 15
MFTGLVSLLVILAVLGSLVRAPRRRDLVWLSAGLVVGVMAQIVLGGLVVVFGLSPPWVMAHFAVSMVLVANAVVLHHRAGQPDGRTTRPPVVSREVRVMGSVLVAMAALIIFAGTVVTGTGPHGGDENVHRLGFSITTVARVHGILVMLFLAAVLVTLWLLLRDGAPVAVRRGAELLLAVLVAQAFIGYVQYFSGVPEVLVAVHIVGAVSVWVATLHFVLQLP